MYIFSFIAYYFAVSNTSKGFIDLCFADPRDSQNLPKLPLCPDLQHQQQPSSKQQQQQPVKQQPRKRIVWKQPQLKETKQRKAASNENSAKTKAAKSDVRSKVDNTRKADSSKLSTILEATEVKKYFSFILSVPKFTANMYCICLSIPLKQIQYGFVVTLGTLSISL